MNFAHIPQALFETKDTLLEASKSVQAKAIWSAVPSQVPPYQDAKCVIGGGALLHRIPWQKVTHVIRYCRTIVIMWPVRMGMQWLYSMDIIHQGLHTSVQSSV